MHWLKQGAVSLSILGLIGLFALAPCRPLAAQDKTPTGDGEARNETAEAPAAQPESGPGSADYAHASHEVVEGGEGAEKYWMYLPREPRPETAPVVIFLHGHGARDDKSYEAWLTHLARRGNIVVYPLYQRTILELPANFAPNAAAAMKLALGWLEEKPEERVQPVRENLAITGHSAGGMTTGNMAADWETLEIGKPKVAMPVQPGRAFGYGVQESQGLVPWSDYSKIPEDCLLAPVFGDSDTVVGSYCAKKFFHDATSVKPKNKNLIEVRSDDHGKSTLVADHQTPGAMKNRGVDVFDWYAYWKLFDALCNAAFHGKNRDLALGGGEKQTFMGQWSDGVEVARMVVTLGDEEIELEETDYEPRFDRNGEPFGDGKASEGRRSREGRGSRGNGDRGNRPRKEEDETEEEY